MVECSVPGCERTDALPFTCNECGDTFCSAHRLPERHGCPALVTDSFEPSHRDSDRSKTGDETVPVEGTDVSVDSDRKLRSEDRSVSPHGRRRGAERSANRDERATGSSPPTRETGSRERRFSWSRLLTRGVVLAIVLLLAAVVLVGFTPMTIPEAVPDAVAEPIQEIADASAGIVATVTSPERNPDARTAEPEPTGSPPDSDLGGVPGTESATSLDRVELEEQVHREVNDVRQSRGEIELEYDEDLQAIARYHSRDMAENEYFAHTAPDGDTMVDRYERFGYRCRVPTGGGGYAAGGENLFMLSSTSGQLSEPEIATRVVEGWMNSPGHRENLLREYWRAEGIGVFVTEHDGQTRVYVTQNFC